MELKQHEDSSKTSHQDMCDSKPSSVRYKVYSLLCLKYPQLLLKLAPPVEPKEQESKKSVGNDSQMNDKDVKPKDKMKKKRCKSCGQKFYSKYL
jgi:hypothetical protein